MSGIQIKDLSFAYEAGGKLILKDINTEIGEGEFGLYPWAVWLW